MILLTSLSCENTVNKSLTTVNIKASQLKKLYLRNNGIGGGSFSCGTLSYSNHAFSNFDSWGIPTITEFYLSDNEIYFTWNAPKGTYWTGVFKIGMGLAGKVLVHHTCWYPSGAWTNGADCSSFYSVNGYQNGDVVYLKNHKGTHDAWAYWPENNDLDGATNVKFGSWAENSVQDHGGTRYFYPYGS